MGRLSEEKRPDLAIGALRALRQGGVDALVVAGTGPLRAKATAEAAGLPVTLLGYVGDRGHLASTCGCPAPA